MNILDKFSAVEIKADNRISEGDKVFCVRQQEAFDKSGPALQKIAEVISATRLEQFSILSGEDDRYPNLSSWGVYITSDGFRCDESYIYETMSKRNTRFIHQIVSYFQSKYSVELDESVIAEHLIPAGPQEPELPWGGYRRMSDEEIDAFKEKHAAFEAEKQKYDVAMRSLPIRYEQIVDEIFVQLGGFSFQERAMNEFLEKCWNAAHSRWNNGKERFEIKNDTIKLDGFCWCDKNKWSNNPAQEYKPNDELRVVLDALVHHSIVQLNRGAEWFPELFKYYTKENIFPVNNLEKVKQIKLFQNGRVDIKFRSATYAQEFVEQYLRHRPSNADIISN